MAMGTFIGLLSLALMVLFIGIIVWAYSSKRKADFDAAAALPFADDDGARQTARIKEGQRHE